MGVRSGSYRNFFLSLAFLLLSTSPLSWSQDEGPVHVVPGGTSHRAASQITPAPGDTSQLLRTKPLRAHVDLVLVPTTVTDTLNRPAMSLKKDNFAIYEDNQLQLIQGLYKEDAPISVGIILDFSKSMSNKFEAERNAVTQFFKNANPEDDYFVIAFSDRPRLIADSTQSIDEIQQKLALTIPAGNTALLDAIYVGIAKMRSARYQRRALLIISDGGDNHSYFDPKQTKAMAEEAGVVMDSIGIFDNMPVPVFKTIEEKLGKRLLTQITELTGGRTITADNRDKIPEIAAQISRELREQYVLAYRSSNLAHDGKFRKIKVQVTASNAADRFRVYCRRGYIAAAD